MSRNANAVDKHVAERMKLARIQRGMSQQVLANAIGVTFQQVQKYENGTNRIAAGRLYQLSRTLNVDIGHFYAGFETDTVASDETLRPIGALRQRDLRVAAKLAAIEDERIKRHLTGLIDAIRPRDEPIGLDD
jgi:transcriptional regulator with XRE-family HTH domain